MLNKDKYDDDEDAWYYADGSGKLYAGEFKTIKGKKGTVTITAKATDGSGKKATFKIRIK